jgi:16S rRNA (guanine527-N7)-methyltransferase
MSPGSFASSTMHSRMTSATANLISLERIPELLAPFVGMTPLTDSQVSAIRTYLEILLKWNSKLNLTAIRDPEEIVTRHFGESLLAARQLFPAGNSHESVIDVGSGAGFPGLPLKLWSQNIDLTLIDSNQRKATFLREVARTLDLRSVAVLAERAESVSLRADVVTFRAVERFERILPVAFGLLKARGRIAILIGEAQVELAQSLLRDVEWKNSMPIPSSKNRRLLIGERRVP